MPTHPSDDPTPNDRTPNAGEPVAEFTGEPTTGSAPTAGSAPGAGPAIRVRLESPEHLVAALPHLLGFVPVESLVLVGLRTENGRTSLGQVIRADLPAAAEAAGLVAACLRRFAHETPDAVVVVVISETAARDEPTVAGPPWTWLVDDLDAACTMLGAAVHTRLWVTRVEAGAPWGCYPPCPCRGVVPDPRYTSMAAAASALGQVTYRSRDQLAASLAAVPQAESTDLRALIDDERGAAELDRGLDPVAAGQRDLEVLRRAADTVAGGGVLDDDQVARVTVALGDRHVRDHCLGWALGDGPITGDAAEQLWTVLTRATPAPEVADAAALLAFAVLLRGGGGLFGVALERALEADPEHALTHLIDALVASGVTPEEIRTLVRSASSAAGRLMQEDHPPRP